MSLYNRLFSENKDATALLGMINCTRDDFMRYRDVYLDKTGTIITVVARIGGRNRKEYGCILNNIRKNVYYKKDFDDNLDDTYTYIQFSAPEEYIKTCKMIAPKEERLSVGELFKKEIEESEIPGTEASKKMEKIVDEIMKNIEEGNFIIDL